MEWKDAVDDLLTRRLERLGGPVSLEEVLTLHDAVEGEVELSEDARERLVERVNADPRAARKLLELMRFPEPVDEEEARAAEAGRPPADVRWQALRARLVAEGQLDPVGEAPVSDHAQRPAARQMATEGPGRVLFPARALPLAASFLLGAAVMLLIQWVTAPPPPGTDLAPPVRINLPVVELLEAGRGSTREARPVALSDSAHGLVVTLTAPELDRDVAYDLVLERPEESALRVDGLRAGPGGVFVLALEREALGDGLHELRLEAKEKVRAKFLLEVTLSP